MGEPDHASVLQPLTLHSHELLVIEFLEDSSKMRLLAIVVVELSIELSIGKLVNCVQVMIFPVLKQLLLNLIENFSAFLAL